MNSPFWNPANVAVSGLFLSIPVAPAANMSGTFDIFKSPTKSQNGYKIRPRANAFIRYDNAVNGARKLVNNLKLEGYDVSIPEELLSAIENCPRKILKKDSDVRTVNLRRL